jgi:hypothetical protein
MSATATSTTRTTMTDIDVGILLRIDRGVIAISETELRYQLHARQLDTRQLLERLIDLEARGLIESQLHVRLTPAGRAHLPADHQPPHRAGSQADWR